MLYYKEYGQGSPIVILHGLYGSSDNWVTIARKFALDFRVIIPDQRNHGHSFHDDEMNFNVLTNDLLEFTKELNLQKFHIIGHSLGGKVAANFVQFNSEKVDKLIMVDVSPYHTKPSKKIIKFHQLVINVLAELDYPSFSFRQALKQELLSKLFSPLLVDFLMKNFYLNSHKKFESLINIPAIQKNIDVILGEVTIKNKVLNHSLIMKGGDSEYFNIDDFDNIKTKFPNIGLSVIDNTTHWLHAEKPNEFYKITDSFLKRLYFYR